MDSVWMSSSVNACPRHAYVQSNQGRYVAFFSNIHPFRISERFLPFQIVSNKYRLISFDCNNVTKDKYATMNIAFRLTMERPSEVMGLITYFRVDFTKSHLPMCISTEPGWGVTSWNQRVFLWPRRLVAEKGDTIFGLFKTVSERGPPPNQKFSITVQYENEKKTRTFKENFSFRLVKNIDKE